MSRPAVSIVVPFAGTRAQGEAVIARFRTIARNPDDELIIADNSGVLTGAARPGAATVPGRTGAPLGGPALPLDVTVVLASGEASAARARNTGAAAASCDWILFLDSDVYPPWDLLQTFFKEPIADEVGAVTGDIHGIPDGSTLAARYGTARNFLGQRSHVMNPYRPRASSANLLVRRAAFTAVGGYTEGIWAAEDTDFTWRLQEAGWKLAFNERAVVRHEYRKTLPELGRQWRGYAAGAAWLSQRYPDFSPDPGLNRLGRILLKKLGIGEGVAFRADGRSAASARPLTDAERLQFFLINCYLGIEEQVGLRMSNDVRLRGRQLAQLRYYLDQRRVARIERRERS